MQTAQPVWLSIGHYFCPSFSLCSRHRHVTSSHQSSPRPSSALTDWWLISAAQLYYHSPNELRGKGRSLRFTSSVSFIIGRSGCHSQVREEPGRWLEMIGSWNCLWTLERDTSGQWKRPAERGRGRQGQPIKPGKSNSGACPPASAFGEFSVWRKTVGFSNACFDAVCQCWSSSFWVKIASLLGRVFLRSRPLPEFFPVSWRPYFLGTPEMASQCLTESTILTPFPGFLIIVPHTLSLDSRLSYAYLDFVPRVADPAVSVSGLARTWLYLYLDPCL